MYRWVAQVDPSKVDPLEQYVVGNSGSLHWSHQKIEVGASSAIVTV